MPKPRAVIYARYSTDLQTDKSIEDQIMVTEEYAEKQGWVIVNHYTDHAISGASLMRPGIQMLLEHASQGMFDIVLSEALDRLSRDQQDIAGIYKRITFGGAQMFTLSEGEINELHIGLKGTMNALFIKDLAKKVHRGLRGKIEKGKSAGGNTYGYDVVKKLGADGELIRGDRTINEVQAKIVNRIFKEYLAGKSPKKIATELNKEGIPAPSAKGWGPSTIYGNRERGTGILNNELYIGRLIWNRLKYTKNPETGRRVSRMNPKDEWHIRDVPEMRIVPQELWEAVKEKQGVYAKRDGKNIHTARRPKNLLSYLLKCGTCGGGVSMVSSTHYGCSTSRNKGTCDNRRTIKRETLEQSVISAMQTHLMDEELTKEFAKEYTRYMNELHMAHNASLHAYRKELERNKREMDKFVTSIGNGAPVEPIKDRMHELNDRRKELEEILENIKEQPILFHPKLSDRYHDEIKQLLNLFNQEEHRSEAADLLRSLVDKIVISPKGASHEGVVVDLHGDLAGILQVATKGDKPLIKNGLSYFNPTNKQEKLVAEARASKNLIDVSTTQDKSQESVVAGVGFEPTTFRL